MRKKCRPQKQPKQYDRPPICNCQKIFNTESLFHNNTHDIAKTLVEILVLSGIHRCKAMGAKDIILDAFHHYDALRHGEINGLKASSIKKEAVILCLATKCMMTCVETYFTYSIIKQLLKAFFISVPECGIRNYIMESQNIYDQQSAWDHVARRTIQIFDTCAYVLRPTVKNYNSEIKRVYQDLFNRMKKRVDPIEIPEYNCRESTKVVIKRVGDSGKNRDVNSVIQKSPSSCSLVPKPCLLSCFTEIPEMDKTKSGKDCKLIKRPIHVPKNTDYPFDNFPRCLKCNFPKQLCNCNVDPRTGKLNLKSSQGPFRCEWYRMDKAYRVSSKHHVCPIDCWDMNSTFSGGECICEEESVNDNTDISECEVDISESNQDFSWEKNENVCSEEAESENEEPEPFMEGCEFCCHMPECNCDPKMFPDKPPCIPEPKDVIGKLKLKPPKKSPGKNRPSRGTDGKKINTPHDRNVPNKEVPKKHTGTADNTNISKKPDMEGGKPDGESGKTDDEKEITTKEPDRLKDTKDTKDPKDPKDPKHPTDPKESELKNETPVGKQPSIEKPDEGSKEPSGKKPNGEDPSGKKPSGEEPSGKKPSGEEPSGKKPSDEETSFDGPSGENLSNGGLNGERGSKQDIGDQGGKKDDKKIVGGAGTQTKDKNQQNKIITSKNNRYNTGAKRRLPCCKCTSKKPTPKRNSCQKCSKLILIPRNRVVPAASFC